MAGRVVRERCVLLLGKSGAGKSTVANHLVGHDPLSPDEPPFRVQNQVFASVREVTHGTVEFMWKNDLYRVTVVDTVGLFDTSVYGNDLIFDKIVQHIRQTNLRIDLILFVMKLGRFTLEEKEVFSFIMARLRSAFAFVSALVVTGCENLTTTAREKLVQEFEVNPDTREIASQMGMGIYPVGFPPVESMEPLLQQAYIPCMVQDRDMLRELIVRRVNIRSEQHCF